MAIKSQNQPVVAMLTELHVQWLMFDRAQRRLRTGARHWRLLHRGRDFDRKFPPGEIMAWATVCLASFMRVRHMLFEGRRKNPRIVRRCGALRRLLGNPPLTHVCSPAVRNSWEHLDEHLDTMFDAPKFTSYSHVTIAAASPENFSFRLFDPYSLHIQFGPSHVDLKACLAEMRGLSKAIDAAFKLLNDGRIVRL